MSELLIQILHGVYDIKKEQDVHILSPLLQGTINTAFPRYGQR